MWLLACLAVLTGLSRAVKEDVYVCDLSGKVGRRFDGVGAISGGGVCIKDYVNCNVLSIIMHC